mmetsp:Transcript_3318/g.8262  ORF Transcript_3318/g.8262 Transcript_3318/m.8262 type:complete len:311 (+) Transcript_3318:1162-2094(+)
MDSLCTVFFARCSVDLRSEASRSLSRASSAAAAVALAASSAHDAFSASRRRVEMVLAISFSPAACDICASSSALTAASRPPRASSPRAVTSARRRSAPSLWSLNVRAASARSAASDCAAASCLRRARFCSAASSSERALRSPRVPISDLSEAIALCASICARSASRRSQVRASDSLARAAAVATSEPRASSPELRSCLSSASRLPTAPSRLATSLLRLHSRPVCLLAAVIAACDRACNAIAAVLSLLPFHALLMASHTAVGNIIPPHQCLVPFLSITTTPGSVTYSSFTRTSVTSAYGYIIFTGGRLPKK